MYVNISVLGKSGLEYSDLVFLCAISQTETDWLIENLKESDYERFERLSLIKHIKQKSKKEHLYTSLRLSDLGKTLLSEIEEAPVEEQDEKVGNWLINHYKQIDKQVGNSKRLMRHIRDFRLKSGIEKNNLIKVCLDFISDEDNMQYNNVLEFAFYKPLTAFQTRFQLEDSRLYKHYLKKEDYFKSIFEEY